MKKQAGELHTEIEPNPKYAEGSMAKYELKAIIEHAQELEAHLEEDSKLEPWIETKITKAKDYIETVADYLLYGEEHEEGEHEYGYWEGEEYDEGEDGETYAANRMNIKTAAEYQGKKVELNKPTKGDVKKFKVYVKNDKGNVVKVNFGDPNMEIKRDNPERRKNFRARHRCENPGPKWKARYWSCKMWGKTPVSKLIAEDYKSRIIQAAKKKQKGLWDNIDAKRKRGEKPAKPGEEGYPDKENWGKLTKQKEQK